MKKAQIQNEDALCIVCREGITNPICPDCLAQEFKSWKPELSEFITKPEYAGVMETTCMFCGKEMAICAHCYSEDVYEDIAGIDSEAAEEFQELFGLREGSF